MATEHRWEWRLAGGVAVAATLDEAMRVETVLVGSRVVSQAARGTKPEGHVLESPPGVVVTFQPGALICILRVDGEEVTPVTWPVRKRAERPKPRVLTLPLRVLAIAAVVAALGGAAYLVVGRGAVSSWAEPGAPLVHRAENGRFLAHYPPSFSARAATFPSGMSGVVLEDPDRADALVLVALAAGDVPREPWLAHQKLHREALANLPRGGPGWEETGRSEERCVGQPGAVVSGRVKNARGDMANVWSCAFVHDGAAYLAMIAARENASSEDARRLRDIVEATELTRLSELGAPRP